MSSTTLPLLRQIRETTKIHCRWVKGEVCGLSGGGWGVKGVNGERREGAKREREGKERMIHTNKIINT